MSEHNHSARPQIADRETRRLQWDFRLGGNPRLVLASDVELMQIPPEIRKCVAFIGAKVPTDGGTSSTISFGGTAFFVDYPIDDGLGWQSYAITARHCLKEIEEHQIDSQVYFRLNTLSNGAQPVPVQMADWITAEDERIDVAVVEFPLNQNFDHRTVPLSMFMTDSVISEWDIGPGAELCFPGLFKPHFGDAANVPIIRMGHIAAMPGDPLRLKGWPPMRAYLAEARSIGGLSGSPVFWQRGTVYGTSLYSAPAHYLLGLVHGHYDTEHGMDFANDAKISQEALSHSINMGIAVIVPASDIAAVLELPELKRRREELADRIRVARESQGHSNLDVREPDRK